MSEIQVKNEPLDALELESRIIQLCKDNASGITDKLIRTEMPHADTSQVVTAINRLLSQEKIEILKKGKQLLYKLKDPEAAIKVKGADTEEKLIYQIIEEAGNKGIWIRDIRYKSNLLLTQVNKILRNLESKKFIKAVKSVSASKKKVYMLYNVEPDRSVTGGAWYSDQEFESEFVDILNQQCYRYLQQKVDNAKSLCMDPISERNASYVSSKEVLEYITKLGISKVQLKLDEIENILDSLIYDGKAEKTVVAATTSHNKNGMTNLYRAIDPLIQSTGLMRIPCSVCPVFEDCHEGGAISPSTCQYMKDWLDY
ncbi:DNA-directed RNA polymerase III subunit RPC6 [Centruroides vittatus]|uniref:DNA-directed RNA polymerase III subunit RPC6 n=1 Tax=Centruroides vittatus TaxID=120091 RepID=UPI0035104FF9